MYEFLIVDYYSAFAAFLYSQPLLHSYTARFTLFKVTCSQRAVLPSHPGTECLLLTQVDVGKIETDQGQGGRRKESTCTMSR
jgi:hypothetical protein